MNRTLPDIYGKIILARPADHSRQAEQYLVIDQTHSHLSLISIERPIAGGFVVYQPSWEVLLYTDAGDAAEAILVNLNRAINEPTFTFTEYGRANLITARLMVCKVIEAKQPSIRLFVPADAACDEPAGPSLDDLPAQPAYVIELNYGRIEVHCDDPRDARSVVERIRTCLG